MDGKQMVSKALTKALTFQAPVARKNFERLRRVHPHDTPERLANRVNRHFLATVTTSGGVSGGVGVIPGAGLPAAGLPAAGLDVVVFTEFSVLYVLTLAEIHGLHPEDIERRRLLVQTVLIGESAITALDKGAGRTVPYWGKQIVEKIPMKAVDAANKVLGPRFITKYGTKQGVLVLSKQIPLGLGAGIGAGANHLVGRAIVSTTKNVFGPPPKEFPAPLADGVGSLTSGGDPVNGAAANSAVTSDDQDVIDVECTEEDSPESERQTGTT